MQCFYYSHSILYLAIIINNRVCECICVWFLLLCVIRCTTASTARRTSAGSHFYGVHITDDIVVASIIVNIHTTVISCTLELPPLGMPFTLYTCTIHFYFDTFYITYKTVDLLICTYRLYLHCILSIKI